MIINRSLITSEYICVVIGLVFNSNNQILISRRRKDVHLPGFWEFPGGKVESNESEISALNRELFEEIGIVVNAAEKVIHFPYTFIDKSIYFHVWKIENYDNEPIGREGQEVRWVAVDELQQYAFPESNKVIFTVL